MSVSLNMVEELGCVTIFPVPKPEEIEDLKKFLNEVEEAVNKAKAWWKKNTLDTITKYIPEEYKDTLLAFPILTKLGEREVFAVAEVKLGNNGRLEIVKKILYFDLIWYPGFHIPVYGMVEGILFKGSDIVDLMVNVGEYCVDLRAFNKYAGEGIEEARKSIAKKEHDLKYYKQVKEWLDANWPSLLKHIVHATSITVCPRERKVYATNMGKYAVGDQYYAEIKLMDNGEWKIEKLRSLI